jgi:hypothetical protein
MEKLAMMRIAGTIPLLLLALGSLSDPLYAEHVSGEGTVRVGLVPTADGISVQGPRHARAGFLANFGTKLVGSITRAQLQYQNVGGGSISDIELGPITGPGASAFSIFDDACTGQTLAPQGTCIITVDFSPSGAETFTAAFDVISTSVNSPETVSLLGEGIFDDIFSDRFESSGSD